MSNEDSDRFGDFFRIHSITVNPLTANDRKNGHFGVKIPLKRNLAITQDHLIFRTAEMALYESR